MHKKIILIMTVILFSINNVFAVEINSLNPEFFSRFNDEYLIYYINQALDNNHSAKQATQRVEQYRQQAKYSLGKELPSFGVSANYLGIKVPRLDNFELKKNAFVLPFNVNYEADLLLKNRDKTRSTNKEYEASKYEEKSVYISLLSDVATVYTNILQYDKLIKLSEENVNIYTKLAEYENKKFQRGVISSTELNNAQKDLESAKNELSNLQKQQETLLMQLAVLTGKSASDVNTLKRGTLEDFEYSCIIPNEIESDVIFSRPDIMYAEKQLEKAKIDIRIARKEFLPTFNITGLWIFNTIAPGTFFSWESSLAAILAGASQDIFTGGRKIANLRIQKARYEELFEKYRETSLEAVNEVNTALCIIKYDTGVDASTRKKLSYESKNLNSSLRSLNQGVISEPEYLNKLSIYIEQENEAVNSKTQRLVNYFTLYKAVGGKI